MALPCGHRLTHFLQIRVALIYPDDPGLRARDVIEQALGNLHGYAQGR